MESKRALVIGANGGIGSACVHELQSRGYQVQKLTSADLDLNHPKTIFAQDFCNVDVLLNCAGHSQGTYLGFLKNDWENQVSQIMVNYVANLALLKHYASSRASGQYVWISTSLLHDKIRPFHSVYASSKQASKTAIDLIRQEADYIDVLEVTVGPTKTGFRYRNFNGAKTREEVNNMYDQEVSLTPSYVASKIADALQHNLKEIYIK